MNIDQADDENQNLGLPKIVSDMESVQISGPIHHQNVFQDHDYKLYSAQKNVSCWSWYIKIYGWFWIVAGVWTIVVRVFQVWMVPDNITIKVDGPINDGEFEVPIVSYFLIKLLDIILWILSIYLGKLCLRTVKKPTRFATWQLFKKNIILTVVAFIIFGIQILIIMCTISISLPKWISQTNRTGDELAEVEYTITDLNGKEWNYELLSTDPRNDQIDFYIAFFIIILLIALTAIAFACCIQTFLSASLVAGFYKFHIATKELEIIQGPPDVRGMQFNHIPVQSNAQSASTFTYSAQNNQPMSRGQMMQMASL